MSLGWNALGVSIAGVPGQWRVEQWALEAMVVTLDCVRIVAAALPTQASGGRVLAAPDSMLGETIVHAFELAPLDDTLASAPRLAVAAAGTAPGSRSAALLLSIDGGLRWANGGGTGLPEVPGSITVPPGAAPSTLRDDAQTTRGAGMPGRWRDGLRAGGDS